MLERSIRAVRFPEGRGCAERTPTRGESYRSGFTMVEIALCLGIIGFALVAIIGVLPTGLSVQRDNREETVINFDANFLMNAIATGARGQDDLTNFIVAITNQVVWFRQTPITNTYWYTPSNYFDGALHNQAFLTNGERIIGLLSTPKYLYSASRGGSMNLISADFRGISGPATDQSTNSTTRDFAFRYRVTSEMNASYSYYESFTNNVLLDMQSSNAYNSFLLQQANLNDVRLRFYWPVLGNGQVGQGRQVFRTSAGGSMTNYSVLGQYLYFIQPGTYNAVTP
jgi:type II secretory pathway pseudopilin PulG